MNLSRALSNAYSGLANSGYRADIAAGNIANASTPSYVRRTVISAENVVGNQGNGVRVAGVERHQDQDLSRIRRDADGAFGRATIIASSYNDLNRELGAPGDEFGMFASFEKFETTMRELSATPESPALQNAVLAASTGLINQFNSLSSISGSLRSDADSNIARSVETVNSALHQLKKLNGDIGGGNEQAGETVALEDERQKLLDTISEIIPIRDIERANGQIDIVTAGGVFLLAGDVQELEFTRATAIPIGATYAEGGAVLSGLSVGQQDLTPGNGGVFAVSSGTLAGFFAVRDDVVPNFTAQLDGLASDLISRLSADSLDPSKPVGAPGIFTDNGGALDLANVSGVASRITLNAAIDPSRGGDVTRFRDGLGATRTGPAAQSDTILRTLEAFTSTSSAPAGSPLAGEMSAVERAANLSSVIGEQRIRHDALSTSALTRSNALFDAEIQKSGVDTDQEMQSLLLIEQSYAANARVIQTVSEMIDRLLQL